MFTKIVLPFLLIGVVSALDCGGNGWKEAETVCYRIIHSRMSFWAAKDHCLSLGGQLLQIANAKEVMDKIGNTLVGNVQGDYRIDGWSDGKWFELADGSVETQVTGEPEFLRGLESATLTLNLEDGSLSGVVDARSHLGVVCQGGDGVGSGGHGGCSNDGGNNTTTEASTSGEEAEVSTRPGVCSKPGAPDVVEVLADELWYFTLGEMDMSHSNAQRQCWKNGGTGLARFNSLLEEDGLDQRLFNGEVGGINRNHSVNEYWVDATMVAGKGYWSNNEEMPALEKFVLDPIVPDAPCMVLGRTQEGLNSAESPAQTVWKRDCVDLFHVACETRCSSWDEPME